MDRKSLLLLWVLIALSLPCGAAGGSVSLKNITGKLWRVIEITRVYDPQFQAHVILEAPDRQRVTVIFRGEIARTLVTYDVITLEPKHGTPLAIPEDEIGNFLTPTLVKLGRTRWWQEWAREQGREINKGFRQFFEPKRTGETDI